MRKGLSEMFAAQNSSRERRMRNGRRFLQKTVPSDRMRRGIIKGCGMNCVNSAAVDSPAIIENRGKKSGLSITAHPCRVSA